MNGPFKLCACGCGEAVKHKRRMYSAIGHHRRKSPVEYAIDQESGCWIWQRAIDGKGYGQMRVKGKMRRAHRVLFERVNGPIAPSMTLDHLCRNRPCVNPAHLESVTMRENILRGNSTSAQNAIKTHCPQGHPYSPDNTWVHTKRGTRICKQCRAEYETRKRYARTA